MFPYRIYKTSFFTKGISWKWELRTKVLNCFYVWNRRRDVSFPWSYLTFFGTSHTCFGLFDLCWLVLAQIRIALNHVELVLISVRLVMLHCAGLIWNHASLYCTLGDSADLCWIVVECLVSLIDSCITIG